MVRYDVVSVKEDHPVKGFFKWQRLNVVLIADELDVFIENFAVKVIIRKSRAI